MAQMPFIPFGPWAPDRSEFNTEGTEQALNVIRTSNGYRPFDGLADAGFAPLVDGQPTGLFFGKDINGNARQFACVFTEPNTTGFYELDVGGSDWDRVGTTDLTTLTRFQKVQFDDDLFVTNFSEGLRSYDLSGSNTFDQVPFADENGGSPGFVKPKFIATIRDILFACYLEDPVDGLVPNRTRWSGLGLPGYWSLNGNDDNLSDFQDVPDAGECRGIVGGEYGTLLMEDGVFRVDFVGPPAIFTFSRVENARGCSEPNSIVTEGQSTYYLSDDGWAKFDGQQVEPIGVERFDRWFGDESAIATRPNMTAKVDPQNQLILWGFDSGGDATDVNDTALIYDYALKEPTYAKFSHSLLGSFISPGYDVEDLTSLVISDPTDYQGVWLAATDYAIGDRVSYLNQIWNADVDPAIGSEPGQAPNDWTAFTNAPNYKGEWSPTGQYTRNGVSGVYAIGDRVTDNHTNAIWEAIDGSPFDPQEEPGTPPGTSWQDNSATEMSASIDDLATSLDGLFYRAGTPNFGALKTNALNTFTGTPDLAVIDTSERRLGGEKRAKVQMVQTAIEGDAHDITVQIGTRNRLGKPVKFGPKRELTADGQYSVLQDSRYQRVRVNITSQAQAGWSDATGVFVRSQPTSLR